MGIFGNDDQDPKHDDQAMQQSVNDVMAHDQPATDNQPANDQPTDTPMAAPANNDETLASNFGDIGELATIKQQALKELSPLVQHLDQSPEEKFHTTMIMLQATDDHNLVKAAFEAAKGIESDKARAQALLDLINEIDYFSKEK